MPNGNKPDLLWSGEHWILYLRKDTEVKNSGSLSLYKTTYSPVGEGTVAMIGSSAIMPDILCTDNRELANFVKDNIIKWEASPFEKDLEVTDASFTRTGSVKSNPEWIIETNDYRISAKWSKIESPTIMDKPLNSAGKSVTHSILFFSEEASMKVNEAPIEGAPFIREGWKSAIGRVGSSCCFAISETIVYTN